MVNGPTSNGYGVIVTRFGQLGTENPQEASDTITQGKNEGKANATTAYEQAVKEAASRWTKKKKSGYVEEVGQAIAGEVDSLIEGGINPMLAHKFSEQGHKIKFPCFAQPKLDGIRCIAIVEDGVCTLWSRTRKQILSMGHIVDALERTYGPCSGKIIFDGELYNHDYKNDFESLVSMIRKDAPSPGSEVVQYHIYDITQDEMRPDPAGFDSRFIQSPFSDMSRAPCVVFVKTETIPNEEAVFVSFEKAREAGYEGVILRNAHAPYEFKRSYNLQKVKEFDDAEFEIVGIEEGRGKLAGHVGSFVCTAKNGQEFKAKAKGEMGFLKSCFENHGLWFGRKLVVKYQGLTGYGIPRFPIGVRFRDSEDF